ncbi:MAG TPA: hypothetical protein VHU89_09585 [Acidobacteriaceae bacterium]|jgi:hypothetical protein|nr:hypothetical protein [Acidobacteriaceae bacterium]
MNNSSVAWKTEFRFLCPWGSPVAAKTRPLGQHEQQNLCGVPPQSLFAETLIA